MSAGQLIQLYKEVAKNLDSIKKKKGTITSLSLERNKKQKSANFALTTETLKYETIIDQMILESKFFKQNPKFKSQKSLVQVSIYDLFFGKKDSKDILKLYDNIKHPLYSVLKSYYSELNSCLVMIKIEKKVSKNEELIPQTNQQNEKILPRYIRVNLKNSSQKEVISILESEGFEQSNEIDVDKKFIIIDEHIPNLLIIPGDFKLFDHPLVTQGKVVIQDKASCFPSFALMDTLKSLNVQGDLIDACAAPGNKTSHIADLNSKKHKVFAFDKNQRRLGTLRNLIKKCNLKVDSKNEDFLTIDPSKYPNVVGIIVDPSCSGSGIHQEKTKESELKERLKKLSSIQTRLVEHAFKFPNVKVVVYSTCSVYNEENEQVVMNLLSANESFKLRENVLSNWKTRGKEDEFPNLGKFCLRAYPEEDLTRNGFFVAVFEKTKKRKNQDELSEVETKKKKK
eukprot:gene2682-3878_t